MSDAVTALGGARFEGEAARVEEAPLQGMVTLRGDLDDPVLWDAVKNVTGRDLPRRRRIVHGGQGAVAWISPDELLLLVPHEAAGETVSALDAALADRHALAVDVSDARAVFRIAGPGAREVLARLCPVDLRPGSLAPGEVRRTRLAQVAAAFWCDAEGAFTLVCFRSVARYAFDALSNAAARPPVGFLTG